MDRIFPGGHSGKIYGEKAFAGTGDADAENQVVTGNRVDILSLIGRLWCDLFLARRIEPSFEKIVL